MGSSKRVTVGYKYHMGEHIAICHGPVDAVLAIDIGERRAWSGNVTSNDTISISKPTLFGGTEREGGVEGSVDVLMGASSQAQNSYLAAKCSPDVPAYRGVLSLVFRGLTAARSFYWAAMNPYIKPVEITARRILQGWNTAVWYPEKAEIGPGNQVTTIVGVEDYWDALQMPEHADPGLHNYAPPPYRPGYGWDLLQAPFGEGSSFTPPENSPWDLRSVLWIRKTITQPANTICTITVKAENGAVVFYNGKKIGVINENNIQPSGGIPPQVLTFVIPKENPAAQETGLIVIKGFDELPPLGTVATYLSAEVIATKYDSPDMNPAHIVYQCITDPEWGMGYPTSQIDTVSFAAAADALFDEGFGISLEWNQQSKIQDFIQAVMDHVGAVFYSHPQTGKFGLKLIRDDYDPESLSIYDESNTVSLDSFQRKAVGETVNEITVKFRDKDSGNDTSVTIQDLASIQSQGAVISQVKQYPGISSPQLAQRVAMRDLIAGTSTLSKITITVNRAGWNLIPGDVFKFSWSKLGLTSVIYRVIGVSYGTLTDGRIRVEAVEDVFGLPANTYAGQQPDGWIDTDQPPMPISNAYLTELSYYELSQLTEQATRDAYTGDESFLVALAEQPSPATTSLLIYTSLADVTEDYVQVEGMAEFTPTAELDGAIGRTDVTANYTAQNGFAPSVGDYVYIDSEAIEITSIDTGTLTIGMRRGVMDTIPEAHADGSEIWQWSGIHGFTSVETDYTTGEQTYVRYIGKSAVDETGLDSAETQSLTHRSRWFLPWPPANVTINTEYFPAETDANITVEWVGRNRLQQTAGLVGWDEAHIAPEAGATYQIDFIDDDTDTVIHSESGIVMGGSGASVNFDASTGDMTRCRVEIKAVRDSFDSWQTFVHAFDLTGVELPEYMNEVLADSPVGYWRMSGSGSTFIDFGSAARNMIALGTGWSRSASLINSGGGLALELDQTTGCALSTSDNHVEHQILGDMTIEAWVRPDAVPTPGNMIVIAMFGRGNSDSSATLNVLYWLAIENNGGALNVYNFHENGTGVNNITRHNYTFVAGNTYHIVSVRDAAANTYEAFVNGTSLGTVAYANDPTSGTSADCRFTIGAGQEAPGTLNQLFDGKIDEVAIYSAKLSGARVSAHYAAGI